MMLIRVAAEDRAFGCLRVEVVVVLVMFWKAIVTRERCIL